MKMIGFVDYYINEWHANNYVGWIREWAKRVGEDFEVGYAWAELDIGPLGDVSTDDWCEKNGVTKCATIDELCERSDYIIILAPSNPETHLRYAESVLKYRKNTYIDKTFAPDFATAKKIFDIAEIHGTQFFSSSALRYARELDGVKGAKALTTTGGGSNFDEYIIHQAEMIVKVLGCDAESVITAKGGDGALTVSVNFASGKRAEMNYSPKNSFAIAAALADGTTLAEKVDSSIIFARLIEDMMRFFAIGAPSFDTRETLAVARLREAAIRSANTSGQMITL